MQYNNLVTITNLFPLLYIKVFMEGVGECVKPSLEELEKALKENNIHLSHQRLKVLAYLIQNREHPTVDQIFKDLQGEIPTLSKTTVYNTLKILVDAGMARVITIEDHESRYDIEVFDHGHFKCESCGEITNFTFDPNLLVSQQLEGYAIQDKNVYFKGVCPKCL